MRRWSKEDGQGYEVTTFCTCSTFDAILLFGQIVLLRVAIDVVVILHRDLMFSVVVLETRCLVMVVVHAITTVDGAGEQRRISGSMADTKRGNGKRLPTQREAK